MGTMISVESLPLAGAAELRSKSLEDSRGWFARYFCQEEMRELSGGREIQQINSSFTAEMGTLRGLHFQRAPHAEDKFIRCLRGRVYDVMLDLRLGSPSFGRWHAVELEAESMNMVFVPRGFAHGFQTLTEDCQLLYLHTASFAPDHQGGLHHASPALNIAWPLPVTEVSARDAQLPAFDTSFKALEV